MRDSQNHSEEKDVTVTKEKKENVDDNVSPPASYYYDDSTGYEIYDDQRESEDQKDSIEDSGS